MQPPLVINGGSTNFPDVGFNNSLLLFLDPNYCGALLPGLSGQQQPQHSMPIPTQPQPLQIQPTVSLPILPTSTTYLSTQANSLPLSLEFEAFKQMLGYAPPGQSIPLASSAPSSVQISPPLQSSIVETTTSQRLQIQAPVQSFSQMPLNAPNGAGMRDWMLLEAIKLEKLKQSSQKKPKEQIQNSSTALSFVPINSTYPQVPIIVRSIHKLAC